MRLNKHYITQVSIITHLIIFMVAGFLASSKTAASASKEKSMVIVIPPSLNPHPPISDAEKARVAFAEQVVELLLKKPLSETLQNTVEIYSGHIFYQNKDLKCVAQESCYYPKDGLFISELLAIHREHGQLVELRHAHVVPWAFEQFQSNMNKKKMEAESLSNQNLQREGNRAMPSLDLQPDEYMVHIYVRFAKPAGWYHLDVIMTEDAEGRLFLRHFFTTPIPANSSLLPPGVKC